MYLVCIQIQITVHIQIKKKCIRKMSYILYIVCKTGLILLYLMMNNFSNIILADIITNY